jgi:putative colanic acid biosynthesis UDP-glucose lipid carrier transferase
MVNDLLIRRPWLLRNPMTLELGNLATSIPTSRRWIRFDALRFFALLGDLVSIPLFSVLSSIFYGRISGTFFDFTDSLGLGLLVAALFVLLAQLQAIYQPANLMRPIWQMSQVTLLWVVVMAFLAMVAFSLKVGGLVSRGATVIFVASGLSMLFLSRVLWARFLRRALESGSFAARRVALIGYSPLLARQTLSAELSSVGLNVVTRSSFPPGEFSASAHETAYLADTISAVRKAKVEEVYLCYGQDLNAAQKALAELRVLPLPIHLVLDGELRDLVTRPIRRFGPLVMAEVHRAPMSAIERAVKRSLDVAISLLALFILSPMLVATGLFIRLESKGSVLFRQSRTGFNNRPFTILKFRSMRVMENGSVVQQASRDDPRVTRVGKLIRRLSIDELPQLWNVLRGDMSIVGPRPHALAHDAHYEKLIGNYPYRQHVKPGLTGWAQVNGSRGETPTVESMAERVRLDLWYVENAGLWLDIRIIARTFIALSNVKHTY